MRWKDQSAQWSMEVVESTYGDPFNQEHWVWQYGSLFNQPGPLRNDAGGNSHDCDYPERLRVVGGGSGDWMDVDGIPIYVRLVVNVKNVGTEDWTDFHLRAISGSYIYGKYVMDSGLWSRYWDFTSDSNGWDYVIGPTTYDGPVSTNGVFSFETWIGVTSPDGSFEVEFWPTVPEPSALLGLGLGASGLLMSLLRRRCAG